MLAALSEDQKEPSRRGRTPLLIDVTHQAAMRQELSRLHQLHITWGSSLHKVRHCVVFTASSEVLLGCHVPFQQTHTQTPPVITSWVIYTRQGRAHSKLGMMLSS